MKFQTGPSSLGKGMFAVSKINEGEVIGALTGEIVTSGQASELIKARAVRPDDPLQIGNNLFIILDEESLYFNHSCLPNAGIRNFNSLVALSDIEVGSEICYDYSTVVGDDCASWRMECRCGQPDCRGSIGDITTIPLELLRHYRAHNVLPNFILEQFSGSQRYDMSLDMTTLGAGRTIGMPTLVKACVIRADIGPALEFATTQGTVRAMFPIIGGEARGAGWTGRILPGGADFAFGLPDGSYAIEARYCLELEDGTPVMVTNAGKMVLQPDGSYHGRTRATLEVPDGPHRALGDAVYFGAALSLTGDDDHVFLELWEAQI